MLQKSLATLGRNRYRVNSARFCISPFSALGAAWAMILFITVFRVASFRFLPKCLSALRFG
jgi:hypothetical protein